MGLPFSLSPSLPPPPSSRPSPLSVLSRWPGPCPPFLFPLPVCWSHHLWEFLYCQKGFWWFLCFPLPLWFPGEMERQKDCDDDDDDDDAKERR